MSTAGIKIWDANGVQIIGPNTSIGSIIGVVETNKINGSITNAKFSLGTPRVFACVPVSNSYVFASYPIITFSGNTMTWTYESPEFSGNPNMRILYGFS